MKKLIYFLFLCIALFLCFCVGMFFFISHHKIVDFSRLEQYSCARPSILLDDEGKELGRFQLDRREPIMISQVPRHLIQAFLSAEDRAFFNHGGISWKGIVRSTLVNMYNRRKMQGASTITQQLTRLLFFDAQKTFTRKLKEQIFALIIEQQFTKEQILEAYMNHIYFGCGIYGVEAACQRFWGKHAHEISLDQAALLAGIVRCPAAYCPAISLENAKNRRNMVLQLMLNCKAICQEEYEAAKVMPVQINEPHESTMPHAYEALRQLVEKLVGKTMLYTGGLTIQTTLNKEIQRLAEKSFKEQCADLRKNLSSHIDGALLSMEVQSGAIKALVGGYNFAQSKFNRALQARRQMGSVFKPLVYAAAVDAGIDFSQTELDEPFLFMQHNSEWQPHNYDHEFNGRMTLAHALSYSNNIVAIKTFLRVGSAPIIRLAQACHMSGPFFPYPSLALGCVDVTLKEALGMFNIFANSGTYVEPHLLVWIKDAWGKKIWKYEEKREKVLHERSSGQVVKVLTLGMERARKKFKTQWLDSESIGKTGTTNESRTCWFAGSTPHITTVVYIGCDDNRSLGKNVYPVRTAFPIWLGLHAELSSHKKRFSYDHSLQEITIDGMSGEPVAPDTPGAITIVI